MATEIASPADFPSDGCITIRGWEHGSRRRGWHAESVVSSIDGGNARVVATPMSITSGQTTGEPREIVIRFGVDMVEPMP